MNYNNDAKQTLINKSPTKKKKILTRNSQPQENIHVRESNN